jgi:hypothetical protein
LQRFGDWKLVRHLFLAEQPPQMQIADAHRPVRCRVMAWCGGPSIAPAIQAPLLALVSGGAVSLAYRTCSCGIVASPT